MKLWKLHWKAGDAHEQAVDRVLSEISAEQNRFSKDDICGAEQTGLSYAMPADQTISQTACSGPKQDKKRINLLVCSNEKGTGKFFVLFIENVKKPRCFNKRPGAELCFDHTCNKRAWMAMVIFFYWLKRLNAFIARTLGRKIMLLLDNFSGHGSSECHPELSSVEVKFSRRTLHRAYSLWMLA